MTSASQKSHRGTIFPTQAEILSHDAFAGDQYIMRVQAIDIAKHAQAGSFVHIQCDPSLPMRRPISIMRVDQDSGWVEFLYKVFGEGTRLLSQRKVGETLDLFGPIGVPFKLHSDRTRPLLIGGGVGIPPMIYLADEMRSQKKIYSSPFVIMGSEVPFPFSPRPSTIMPAGMPDGTIACMPLLEDWGIASRLTSTQGYPGCFDGYVTDLARHYLDALDKQQRTQIEVFSCGPTIMLKAVAQLAKDYNLPCQVSLEEHMACAVGGCAGCTVKVETRNGPAMKRVCVDGPVFDAHQVVF
ncbi:Dihydroorotate dehydrogenase (NAD(+)), electron transfer subunit [hydrothermal vent metagenome]|uniref:Dihydroorotate dehydrogenase (NAD(+)), electron transfer subunit n=1 Tax=hydrothermal vent metagenome TaxID=652676 RepID=A0A3B1A437_9ZZZZ